MRFRNFTATATITMIGVSSPVIAQSYDIKDLPGTYTSDKQGFVHIKKLVVSKTSKGAAKVSVTLAGFPDDIYLGEAVAEAYPNRDKDIGQDKLMVTVSNGKLTDIILIGHQSRWADWSVDINATSFMKYADGRPNVGFSDVLKKETTSK